MPPGPHTKTDLAADQEGERLDVFVTRRLPALTRSRVQRLIAQGAVAVSGQRAKPSLRLEVGMEITVDIPPAADAEAAPEAIPLDVLYEDNDILVVNKPPGMTVHPSPGHTTSTLVNAILSHCDDLSGIGGVARPGIVHRLDRDTSGVILVAKNDGAHNGLSTQLRERKVEKTYMALVEGTPKPPVGIIDAAIGRDPRNRKRMSIVEGGRQSETGYRVSERFRGYSLIEASPKTGRTHQIRVHLAAVGHPIVGDRLYGKPSPLIGRQFLHARRIVFTHPRTAAPMDIEAPLPSDLERALAALRGA